MKSVIRIIPFILIGTALFAGTVTGTVTDFKGDPLAGANVIVEGTDYGTATAADGSYTIRNVRQGTYTLTASFIGYESASQSVVVGAGKVTVNFSLSVDAVYGKAVSVIGSRFARTAEEQAVPVDVFTAEDIRKTGYTETAQIIQSLAPSFNLPRTSITDGSDAVRPMTLRGLSSGQVLVLVNGKRRHTTALVHVNNSPSRGDTGVDLNAIPASAIERIEVLRDGAAAQYGSDAIAGVLNIVLKSGSDGGDFTLTAGQTYHTVDPIPSDFDLYNWEDYGEPFEWNPTGDVNYSQDATGNHAYITGSEEYTVNDGQVFTLGLNKGLKLGEDGSLSISAEYRHRGRTNRIGFEGERYYMPYSDYWTDNKAEANRLNDGSDFYIDPKRMMWGDGKQDNLYAFYNADLPQGNKRFYSFGGYSYRKSDAGCFTRQPDQANKVWLSQNPTGYVPRITPTIVDYSFVAGMEGVAGDWAYDVSSTLGKNDFHFYMFSTNASFGPEKLRTYDIGGFSFSQWTNNLDLTTRIDDIDVATGAEFRQESYRIYAGEQASYANGQAGINVVGWETYTALDDTNGVAYADTMVLGLKSSEGGTGCQCFSGFKPSNAALTRDADRSSFALYGDFEKEFLSNLRAGLALRYENYSDFGSTFNYKLTTRYEYQPGIIFRAGLSTGFRAPALAQAFQYKVATNFLPDRNTGQTVAFEVGTFPVSHPFAQALGAEELKPETSTNISGGFSLSIIEGLKINFDFYNIAIKDRIVLSGNFTANEEGNLDSDGDGLPDDPLGYRVWELLDENDVNATGGRFFTNAVSTTTQGYDIVLSYDMSLADLGDVNLSLAYNQTETSIDDIYTPAALEGFGAEAKLFDNREARTMTTAQPKNNLILTGIWTSNSAWSAKGTLHRYGEHSSRYEYDKGTPEERPQWFSAKTLIDLEVSYDLGPVVVTLGGNNLTDEMPDKITMPGRINDGAFVYPNFSPFGMNGRFMFMRLNYDF